MLLTTHSPLCCVRTVILINSLCVGGGGGGDGVSIQTRTYFPSLDNNAVRETKRCIKKKTRGDLLAFSWHITNPVDGAAALFADGF